MRRFIFLSVLFIVYCQEDIAILSEYNFSSFISEHPKVLVNFYAPWCELSSAFFVEFEKVVKELKGELQFAKVNIDTEENLAKIHDIIDFPTIKYFKNGKYYSDFDGDRVYEELLPWIKRRIEPPSLRINNEEEWKQFLNLECISHIVYFPPLADDLKDFELVADDPDFIELRFGHIFNESLRLSLSQNENTVVVYREGNQVDTLNNFSSKSNFKEWIVHHGYPRIEKFKLTQEFIMRTGKRGRPLLIGFLKDTNTSTVYEQHKFIEMLAETPYHTNIHFLEAVVNDEPDVHLLWGSSGEKYPAFILVNFKDEGLPSIRAFDEEKEVTKENIFEWLTVCINGTECPYNIISESVNLTKGEDNVKVIVGKNYKQIVNDPSKDVIVQFYSPKCPDCPNIDNLLEEIGQSFLDVDSVLICKYNIDRNTVPYELRLRTMPAIVIFKAKDKSNPIEFWDSYEYSLIMNFILENVDINVDIYKIHLVQSKIPEDYIHLEKIEELNPNVEIIKDEL